MKLPFPGIAKTWDWDCSLAILGLQMPLGSGASYSFNPRIAREVLKSTQRVPQSQDCTKFQDCVGCTILGLRVRNWGCCAHNTRTAKEPRFGNRQGGGFERLGIQSGETPNTREIREEQMDRPGGPAAVGRGRFKPLGWWSWPSGTHSTHVAQQADHDDHCFQDNDPFEKGKPTFKLEACIG